MAKIKEYIFPADIDEAVKLSCEEDVIIVSGGTGVIPRRKDMGGKKLVDISRLEFSNIKKDNEYLNIGPALTISDIEINEQLKDFSSSIFFKAAENVASRQIRNQVTLGGNIVCGFPWADMPPALLCVDAEFEFSSKKGVKKIDSVDYFLLKNNEKKELGLLVNIKIPLKYSDYISDFYAFQKTVVDYSMATVVTTAKIENNNIKDIKIAISGCTRNPIRLKELEKEIILLGNYEKDSVHKIVKKHTKDICNIKDFRITSDYAENIISIHLLRMILKYVGQEVL